MKIITFIQSTLCAGALMTAGQYVPAMAAEEPLKEVAVESAPSSAPGIAAGAVEDTLAVCMARIPKDASIGQRMMAEQGCWRDESDRKPSQSDHGPRQTSH